MNPPTGNFELLEPASPEVLVPDSPVEPWMIGAATLLAIFLLALLILVMMRKKKANPASQRNLAHAEAAAALDALQAADARDAAVRSSLILRRYLSIAANDPSLFETHEETISRHEAFKGFSDETRLAVQASLSRLAALKYAAQLPDASIPAIIADSRALLETLHHGFQA